MHLFKSKYDFVQENKNMDRNIAIKINHHYAVISEVSFMKKMQH